MVHWIDAKTLEIKANTLVDPRPRALNFSADGKQLWVTSEMNSSVIIIDVATKEIIHTIHFSIPAVGQEKIQPVGVVIDALQSWAYVALGPSNRVAVINAKTYQVEKYLLVGARVWNLAFSPNQERVYTTNGASHDISIIDTQNHKVIKSIAVGRYPWGLAVKR
jgi:YVTN family beta-propeller protein